MLFKNLLFTFIFLCGAKFSFGAEKIVNVATLVDYAPFCFMDDKKSDGMFDVFPPGTDTNKFKGYSWDVLRESFHIMGYTINLSVTPWVRAMQNVKSGKADVLFPAGKNAEREKIFHFSGESINPVNYLVYVRAGNPIKWKGLESLKGLTIGEKRGFSYGDKWKSATYIKKHPISRILQGFRMLDLKRIDGFAGYEFNWDFMLKQAGWEKKYSKLPQFYSSDEYLIALKGNPQAVQILKDFDAGKQRLIKTGLLQKLQKKWGVESGFCTKNL